MGPLLPASFLKKVDRRFALLKHDFDSYKIAYENLKDETGLIYLHLNKTDFLKQKMIIIDKIGIYHEIDLDSMEFLIQKGRAYLF